MNEVALHRGQHRHLNVVDAYFDGQHLTEAVVSPSAFLDDRYQLTRRLTVFYYPPLQDQPPTPSQPADPSRTPKLTRSCSHRSHRGVYLFGPSYCQVMA